MSTLCIDEMIRFSVETTVSGYDMDAIGVWRGTLAYAMYVNNNLVPTCNLSKTVQPVHKQEKQTMTIAEILISSVANLEKL